MHLILNLANVAMLILCGANFPIQDLPQFAQYISYSLPFTRSIEAGKMLLGAAHTGRLVSLLVQELCVGLAYLLISVLLLKTIERIAIRKASLEIF